MRFLFLEDSIADAELAEYVIRKEWPDCEVHRVENRSGYEAALADGDFNMILSDYSMPGFDGLAALEIARRRCPEKPFLFLSGTIGEERAVEALQHGATDYIIKDRPGRLVPAIRQALKSADDAAGKMKIEAAMLRTQRMESIGVLAGGVAHDLNNLLNPVAGAAALLRSRMKNNTERELLAMIESGAEQGAALVRQLLAFARGSDGVLTEVQPSALIADLCRLLQPILPENIRLVTDCDESLWPVQGNAIELNQVLMNLCANARDAMPDGGVLEIAARNVPRGVAAPETTGTIPQRDEVLISVADTGRGVSPSHVDRIFEPFFTTKEFGKGSGLGLSAARGIVLAHRGRIEVAGKEGKGAKFEIHLPAKTEPKVDAVAQTATRRPGGIVLVIDDNEGVRNVLTLFLRSGGYTVAAAADGIEGLNEYRRNRDRIQVVVTDIMMPGLSGIDVIRAMRASDPKLAIVAISGLIDSSRAELERMPGPPIACLSKPVNRAELFDAIDSVSTKAA